MTTRIGKRFLQKLLSESVFNPNEINGLNIILNMNDASYCETRAVELIQEAKNLIKRIELYSQDPALKNIDSVINSIADGMKLYHEKMTQAISLMVMSRAMRLYESSAKEKSKPS